MSQITQTSQKIDIRPLFGLGHVPSPVYLDGYAEPGPDTPEGSADYVWQRGHIQDMVTFSEAVKLHCRRSDMPVPGKAHSSRSFIID
ncbi:hypothetical protein ACFQAT_26090 [Undibacterium arcticum]|uniref:hypothetical protein n=1 Tax=Undibacterium arcticum TaxID=1762892 RepID=UPI0036205C64